MRSLLKSIKAEIQSLSFASLASIRVSLASIRASLASFAIISVSFASFAFFLASCHSTRKIQTAIAKKDTVVAKPHITHGEDSAAFIKENYQKIRAQEISFTTFSAKIDVDYVGGDGKKESVNATLRMYKDSVIWIAVTGLFGIEGLRAYINKDSIRIINKVDKIYTGRSVAYVQEVAGLPLDLHSLQELVIGNPVFLDSNIVSYTRSSNSVSFLSIGVAFKNLITVMEGLLRHSKLDDVDRTRNRTCDLSYDEYDDKKGVNFSARRRITVSEKSKFDIKLDFKSYNFNETLSFPFSVPKNYTWN